MHNKKIVYLIITIFLLVSCANKTSNKSDEQKPVASNTSEEEFVTDVTSLLDYKFSGTIEDAYISALFRNKKQIMFEHVDAYKESKYIVNINGLNEYAKVKEVILEPLKISADYAPSESLTINEIDSIKLCTSAINEDVLDIISKIIPINSTLSTNTDVPYEEYNFPSGKKVSVWFYPICYEVTYGENTYRILKIEEGNEFNKMCSDGIYELRFYDYNQ